jgi:hypothetical protein
MAVADLLNGPAAGASADTAEPGDAGHCNRPDV